MRGGRRIGAWLIVLAAVAALAGCASGGASSAATAPRAATRQSATATQAGEVNGAFVCANPQGSTERYAYVGSGRQLYDTQGCAAPVAIAAPTGHLLSPIAFSPSGT